MGLVDIFNNSLHKKKLSSYGVSIRGAGRIFWRGDIDKFQFVDMMFTITEKGLERAWREGASRCNISPEERTEEEWQTLRNEIAIDRERILPLADFIEKNSKKNGIKFGVVLNRLAMWTNHYAKVIEIAQQMSCSDKKARWELGKTEHCSSCMKLNGRVHRMSVWRKYDIYPKHRNLACGGFRCGCRLVITDDKATPGRPPSIP